MKSPHPLTTNPQPPLIVIVGPTASGKTALAVTLAQQHGGEIICADSRTVYTQMDIGTAKPTKAEQAQVPHWGLDLVEPGQRFTAADFKRYATAKIDDIRARGKVPFLVGGTGLYIDAVLFDYKFGAEVDTEQRVALEAMTIARLQQYCIKNNIKLPENSANKRYVIRAIERQGQTVQRSEEPISTSIIVGITTNRDELRQRIAVRAEQLLTNNVVEEAIKLGERYGWDSESMKGNVYPLVRRYLAKEIGEKELVDKITTTDWRLAKRQLTWLKRNPYITWLSLDGASDFVAAKLALYTRT